MDIGDEAFHYFPSHLDDQSKIMLWDLDEAMSMIASVGIGIVVKQLMIFAILGFTLAYILARVKAVRGRGYLATLCYWYLPHNTIFKFKRYPPSYVREYVG